ncbi:MAG: ABC transporter substrate-binding protein [Candidatus Aminicenantes bacterium]|nr:ABC transporter substrate-binding protein [Candidatus Aminicenantes bacterium]
MAAPWSRAQDDELTLWHRSSRLLLLLPLLAFAGERGTLRIACFDFPRSFNPVYATNETSQAIANKVYQSLFFFDRRGEVRPELVESFSWDEDRLEITLQLKRGTRFADGSPLGSRDVVATVGLLKDPRYDYPYLSDLDFLRKIEATGPLTLRLTLKGRFAPWKNYLTFKILHTADVEGLTADEFRRRVPQGSGPYRLDVVHEPWVFELRRNPHWPRPLSYDRIRYTVLGESRQAPLKLMNAEVDAVEISADDARSYGRVRAWRERFRLLAYKKFGYTYLVFNVRNPRIDERLRRVVYNKLLTTRFLDDFLQGMGERVFSSFLLLSSALPPRPLVVEPLTEKRRLRILANGESVVRKQLVLFLCEEMKDCQIELHPEFVEYQMFLQRLKKGDFDLAVSAFLLDMDWNMKDVLSSAGYFNYAGYSSPEMDAVLEAGLREMDEAKRRGIYRRAHELWREDLPLIPLFSLNYYMGLARSITPPRERFELIGSCGDFFYHLQGW